jgi:capsular exopolysaccharide synthesis family protein
LNLRDLASVVWKHRYLVLFVTLLCVALGAAFALAKEETYESTAKIAVTPDVKTQGFVPAENLTALLGNYAETAESGTVEQDAEQVLGRPLDADINASTEAGTGILEVSARADSAEGAREAAEAVTEAFVSEITPREQFVSVDVIDPPATPDEAVQPRPPLIIASSLIAGLGLAVLLALAVDRLRRRIETSDDLAEVTSLPLLGQIPRDRRLSRTEGPQLVWDDERLIDLQESFRSVRTNLAFVAGGGKPAIQVTSAGLGAGKTTTVANLGMAFAQMGVKTALVDADLRRPALHQVFGVENVPWARDPERQNPAKGRETRYPNLFVLPAGPAVRDPAGVLHVAFARMLDSLRDTFDVILIDSPPVLPVSDAKITARWADGVVMVVASRSDRPSAVERSIDELEIAGPKIKGVVLNQAPEAAVGYEYARPAAFDGERAERPEAATQRMSATRERS